jgi:hypothetical protein
MRFDARRQGDGRPLPLHEGGGMVGGRFANEGGKQRRDRAAGAISATVPVELL